MVICDCNGCSTTWQIWSNSTSGDLVTAFAEKPKNTAGYINGGFFVLEPCVFDFIDGDQTAWEDSSINALIERKQLVSYTHRGFGAPWIH